MFNFKNQEKFIKTALNLKDSLHRTLQGISCLH